MCEGKHTECVCRRCNLREKGICDPCVTEAVLVYGVECCENINTRCNLYESTAVEAAEERST